LELIEVLLAMRNNFLASQKQGKVFFCKIIYGNTIDPHLSQILAGYQLLKDEGILKFNVEFNPKYIADNYIHNVLIEVNFNNGQRIVYDLSDGYQSFIDMKKFDKILDNLDYYFKRSSKDKINSVLKNKQKIKTLGFNYPVSCKNNPFDKFIYTGTNYIDHAKKYVSFLRNVKRNQHLYYYNHFENEPNFNDDEYKILYSVRLWDHEKIKFINVQNGFPELDINEAKQVFEKWQLDCKSITQERITQIRALKEHFGDKFVGGVSKSELSLRIANDIIAPNEVVNKLNYMQLIKGNFICVANRGLHNSIGWKFGEYIAASRAIITESLSYDVVGDFEENKNYATFNSTESLIEKAEYLLNNRNVIHDMEKSNQDYYNAFLRPDKLILNTLEVSKII
jgi:hypothetical protein